MNGKKREWYHGHGTLQESFDEFHKASAEVYSAIFYEMAKIVDYLFGLAPKLISRMRRKQ